MRFERVTFSAFADDMRKFEPVKMNAEKLMETWNGIKLPVRSTKYSAGYDICTPVAVTIPPHSDIKIPSGVKAVFNEDELATWHLQLFVRSSVGNSGVTIKHNTGVIDSDYQFGLNDGDMILALINNSDNLVQYKAGDRICQGVFLIHGIAENDNATGDRVGGMGSTNA